MFNNNLFVNVELRLHHFEDNWSTRPRFNDPEERFERVHTESIWSRIEHFLTSLIEVVRIPSPSFGQADCQLSMAGC
jgi:hypothetical protein